MKVIKYIVLVVLGIVVLVVLAASPFIIKARSEADRMYQQYAAYTEQVLMKNVDLKPYPVKPEFRVLHPWKFLKMFKIAVKSRTGEKLARVNTLDATMFLFMKMFTMVIRPDYGYNLPMLSVDFIFMGGKRVFVIEVIDPAKIDDENIRQHYAEMRKAAQKVAGFEQTGVRDWYKDYITDFSIHVNADRSHDDMLLDIYGTFLEQYMDMTRKAAPIDEETSGRIKDGIEGYVSTLLAKGGPAVDVFKQMLGPEGQQEYVRTVTFGLDR